MNYIRELQHDKVALQLAHDAYAEGIMDLTGYLLSPKFHEDTTVQVQDVLNRLAEIKSAAGQHMAEVIRS